MSPKAMADMSSMMGDSDLAALGTGGAGPPAAGGYQGPGSPQRPSKKGKGKKGKGGGRVTPKST
jgi:hypothetical protein